MGSTEDDDSPDDVSRNPTGESALRERLELVSKVLASPPTIHRHGTGVWSTEQSCYEFMARKVGPGSRTLETGCGVSTVLFAGWGCDHLCVVPAPDQRDGIMAYCADNGIDAGSLSFDLRGSEWALPALAPEATYDLVFIDGSHGFPLPIIDWFYGAAHLRDGGVAIFDDRQLPQVNLLLEWFLDRDPRWVGLQSTPKWAAYRRHSSGPLGEIQTRQPFLDPGDSRPAPSLREMVKRDLVRPRMERLRARRTSR